jgi:hypothetical protein
LSETKARFVAAYFLHKIYNVLPRVAVKLFSSVLSGRRFTADFFSLFFNTSPETLEYYLETGFRHFIQH